MNILIFCQYFPPDFGGASKRAYNIAKALKIQGCNVVVITSFPHYPHGNIPKKYSGKFFTNEELDGIKIIRTRIPNLSHSTNFKRVILHLSFVFWSSIAIRKIKNVDIIFAMNPNIFAFFPAWIAKKFFHKKIIRNVDDLWPEVFYDLGIVKFRLWKKILDFVTAQTYRIPNVITPISEGYVDTIIKKYNIPSEKIIVIEHGVDTKKFYPQNINHNKKKIVMYSGALTIGYDFQTLLKSAKLLEKENLQFIIRGTGELYEDIKKNIIEENLKNVELNSKLLPEDELIKLLNTADVFVLPMSPSNIIDKGLPTKILEFQALGKPIVCLSKGESGNYVNKTNSGIVVNESDPEKLAQAIHSLCSNDDLIKKLGMNGLSYIQKNLTLEKIGKRFLEIISSLQN